MSRELELARELVRKLEEAERIIRCSYQNYSQEKRLKSENMILSFLSKTVAVARQM